MRERTRSYESPLRADRAAQTRAAAIAAAHRLFTTKGWAGTGMRDVAAEAGVATETVYAHFANKRGLLLAVLDVAVVGDDRAVPLAEREGFAALGTGSRAARIATAARLMAEVYARTAPLTQVVRDAAAADEELAATRRRLQAQQRQDLAAAFELIVGRTPTEVERDGFWAITSTEVYVLLVEDAGWDVEQYVAWMEATLGRLFGRTTTRGRESS